jgi:regulator of sigma E protease
MSFVLAIVALALLIVLHEGGHFLVARLCGMRVERFSIGFGNPLVSFKRGDTIYQIAPIPLGGFVQITGLNPHEEFDKNDPYVYPNRPRWMRLAVLVAGPAANYLTACFIALFVFIGFGTPAENVATNTVEQVLPGSAAEKVGLQRGDQLIEANQKALSAKLGVSTVIKESKGEPVVLKLTRNGQPLTVTVTPLKDKASGDFRIGVKLTEPLVKVPVLTAIRKAFVMPAVVSVGMLENIGQMIVGKQKPDFSGPVGITRALAQTAEEGMLSFLRLVMFLSIYLGLFNLLPLPALDGGRALFLGINSLRSKDLNAKTEATVHMVGLALLLGLFVIVTFKDIKEALVKLVSG